MQRELLLLLSKQQKFKEIEGSDREYRKELIYEGTFEKDGQKFFLGKEDFNVWLSNFENWQATGNKVYLQLEHDDSPEATRGEVMALELGKNEDNLPALFGRIKFRDEEAEDLAKSAQVSVYIKPEVVDGKGNEYKGGFLAHVALTQSPVIPGLKGFEIAASLVSKKGKSPMIKTLARELGVEGVGDDSDDTVVFSKVLSLFQTLTAALEDMKKGGKPKEGEDEDPPKEEGSGEPPEKKEEEDPEKKKEFPMAASFVKRFANAESKQRKGRIDSLVSDGRVTKAVADDLKKEFCEVKSLSLSFDSEGDGFKDGFDRLAETLAKNERVLSFRETSGNQTTNNSRSVSATVANAESRAAAAK